MKKVLPACEPLCLLYFKDNTISTDNSNELTMFVSPSVELLLHEFKDVFPKEIPHGLPPSRGIEHKIDLLLRASFPNMPTYRSNPQETEEIQKQVQDLMQSGWVQESLSSCVVPIILVPKKDRTWRMCTNCRAINNITVKYRHPIPRLDDILDELHGACVFLNLI